MPPDIEITDQLDKPFATGAVDLSHPSSLLNYLKSELLHLAVLPDFLARKDSKLSQAATRPIEFKADVKEGFQLGNTKPEIQVTPAVQAVIRVNATPGSELVENDPFHADAEVPDHTGYVSVGFQGSLDLGVSGSDGDLTFGLDSESGIGLEYFKAFPLGSGEPTLGDALVQTMATYVIPADISDLSALNVNDMATASGSGSLQFSAGVQVNAVPNPLVSISLPLGGGSAAVKAGVIAGVSGTFKISGNYQVRARRIDADTIELSFLRESGTTWKAEPSASAGIAGTLAGFDLISALIGAISTDPAHDKQQLASLRPEEVETLAAALKSGLDHSLKASIDLVLSTSTDDQAAFQYYVQPAKLSMDANVAVHKALDGDLTRLTAMEDAMQDGGILAPGLQMRNSLSTKLRKGDTTLKINLLGIVNLVNVSDLILKGEVLSDEVSGDVTIKETVTGNRISAITNSLDRNEALRKAIFDSVLATTSYRAGKAITLPPALTCQQVHFALNQKTNQQIFGDYLNWFCALRLLTTVERPTFLAQFAGNGPSTCVLRTSFSDNDCTTMFLGASGNLRGRPDFLEIGRQAMRALLDRELDPLRYQIVDDALWPKALEIGASPQLGTLVGLSTADPRVGLLVGDVFVITGWADAMSQVGAAVLDVRNFVGSADPGTLVQNNVFKQKSGALQSKLAAVVKASTIRFDEPWGMVSLYWAAGSPSTSYGKIVAAPLNLERGHPPQLPVEPHS